jgi:hypothetical protein
MVLACASKDSFANRMWSAMAERSSAVMRSSSTSVLAARASMHSSLIRDSVWADTLCSDVGHSVAVH